MRKVITISRHEFAIRGVQAGLFSEKIVKNKDVKYHKTNPFSPGQGGPPFRPALSIAEWVGSRQ